MCVKSTIIYIHKHVSNFFIRMTEYDILFTYTALIKFYFAILYLLLLLISFIYYIYYTTYYISIFMFTLRSCICWCTYTPKIESLGTRVKTALQTGDQTATRNPSVTMETYRPLPRGWKRRIDRFYWNVYDVNNIIYKNAEALSKLPTTK